MTLSTVLAWSLPAVIVLATVEGLILTFVARRAYDWRSWAASATDALVREYLVSAFVTVSLVGPLIELAWRHRLTTVPLNGFASLAVLFLGQEFCYYWFHRAAHRVRWFWATHAVHHSPNEFNLGIAYRFGWTGKLAGNALFFVPMIWLGFPPQAVFAALSLNLLYQFWLHTEWVPKLGWLEYVLNTPSHHRVHHASNADRDYGGVLIVFDRLFGTFAAERSDLPCRYGLVTPLVSNNPIKIASLIELAWRHRLTTVPLNGFASLAVLFLGQEFCYYWFHRAAHRVRWFWATHAVHHSPNEFNLGIAYRFGWTGKLAGNALFFVPMIWLGFPPQAVFAALSLNLLYQFWLHTEWVPKLGWLKYVLNTPSHHRVHHASNADRDYGGVLIVFDRLFGTFAAERSDLPCRYGLVTPLVSNNPIKIAFHEWLKIAKDLRGARTAREVIGYLFGPPAWRPDKPGVIAAAQAGAVTHAR